MNIGAITLALAALALSGCERDADAPPRSDPIASPSRTEPASIIRSDIEVAREEPPLVDLETSVSFAEGGSELSKEALAELQTILASPQMEAGGLIVLRGHTDSVGRDEANLRISKARAEAVRDHLVEEGVDEERIRIFSLGEMRPVAPNATLEGKPYEEGRTANRRVDVLVKVPPEDSEGNGASPDQISSNSSKAEK